MEKTLKLIDTKIKEHKIEIDGAQKELMDERAKPQKSVVEAAKLLVLKDKAMFHRVAVQVLEDLKKDLQDV